MKEKNCYKSAIEDKGLIQPVIPEVPQMPSDCDGKSHERDFRFDSCNFAIQHNTKIPSIMYTTQKLLDYWGASLCTA